MDKLDRRKKNTLDLGCGDRMKTVDGMTGWGIDWNVKADRVINNVDVFVDNLPFENESFDIVYAYDFLEHVPTVIYKNSLKFPRIHLMNEVWRVLKEDGIFESLTPFFNPKNPRVEWCQDPTHTIPWCKRSFKYFSDVGNEWDRLRDIYNIKARFNIEEMEDRKSHLFVRLRK